MSNIIRLNETAPNERWIVMSNQGTDCFLDLLIIAADTFEKTKQQSKLISFLKDRKEINDIAPGTAGFDLDEMPWAAKTFKDDAEFLLCVIEEAQKESIFAKLPFEANPEIIIPWLKQFALLVKYMKSKAISEIDYGRLNLSSDEVTYTYKRETYRLSSHSYEPYTYTEEINLSVLCIMPTIVNIWQKHFWQGKRLKRITEKDYDKEYNEEDFCRILAAAPDSGCDDMDLFYAAKLAKERFR